MAKGKKKKSDDYGEVRPEALKMVVDMYLTEQKVLKKREAAEAFRNSALNKVRFGGVRRSAVLNGYAMPYGISAARLREITKDGCDDPDCEFCRETRKMTARKKSENHNVVDYAGLSYETVALMASVGAKPDPQWTQEEKQIASLETWFKLEDSRGK